MAQKGNQKSTGGVWHPKYWKETEHGVAWDRVKEALHRDWEQTKKDFGVKSARELHQGVADTVRQAAGREVIPAADLPNPRPSGNHATATNVGAETWERVEPAMQYGVGAQREYGASYSSWDDQLEHRLSDEWDEKKTGQRFDEVKPYVQKGWEGVRPNATELATHVEPGMPVVCSNDKQFAVVDHLDGEQIKLKRDENGQHHWIPIEWVTRVDGQVHVDRPGDQAMREWSSEPV